MWKSEMEDYWKTSANSLLSVYKKW